MERYIKLFLLIIKQVFTWAFMIIVSLIVATVLSFLFFGSKEDKKAFYDAIHPN